MAKRLRGVALDGKLSAEPGMSTRYRWRGPFLERILIEILLSDNGATNSAPLTGNRRKALLQSNGFLTPPEPN